MKTHILKVWPQYYTAILEGRKTFEMRREENRRFEEMDMLLLREFNPEQGYYTGRKARATVSYLSRNDSFVRNKCVVLSLTHVESIGD